MKSCGGSRRRARSPGKPTPGAALRATPLAGGSRGGQSRRRMFQISISAWALLLESGGFTSPGSLAVRQDFAPSNGTKSVIPARLDGPRLNLTAQHPQLDLRLPTPVDPTSFIKSDQRKPRCLTPLTPKTEAARSRTSTWSRTWRMAQQGPPGTASSSRLEMQRVPVDEWTSSWSLRCEFPSRACPS